MDYFSCKNNNQNILEFQLLSLILTTSSYQIQIYYTKIFKIHILLYYLNSKRMKKLLKAAPILTVFIIYLLSILLPVSPCYTNHIAHWPLNYPLTHFTLLSNQLCPAQIFLLLHIFPLNVSEHLSCEFFFLFINKLHPNLFTFTLPLKITFPYLFTFHFYLMVHALLLL